MRYLDGYYNKGSKCKRCGSNRIIVFIDTEVPDLSYKICDRGHREEARVITVGKPKKKTKSIPLGKLFNFTKEE